MCDAIAVAAPLGDVILGTSNGGIADNLVVDDVLTASPVIAGPGQMVCLVIVACAAVFPIGARNHINPVAGTRRSEATLEVNAFHAVGGFIERHGLRCSILLDDHQLALGMHPTGANEKQTKNIFHRPSSKRCIVGDTLLLITSSYQIVKS